MSNPAPCRPGTAVWVDLSTNDVEGAVHLYERLFGWPFDEHETDTGAYVVARLARSVR